MPEADLETKSQCFAAWYQRKMPGSANKLIREQKKAAVQVNLEGRLSLAEHHKSRKQVVVADDALSQAEVNMNDQGKD